jgi:hypothetical protein
MTQTGLQGCLIVALTVGGAVAFTAVMLLFYL